MTQKPTIRRKSKEKINPEQVIDKIKKIAKNIREASSTTRETVKKFPPVRKATVKAGIAVKHISEQVERKAKKTSRKAKDETRKLGIKAKGAAARSIHVRSRK